MVCTFEMQKVKASPQEAEFFGFMPWLVILRLTMPLVVFFRYPLVSNTRHTGIRDIFQKQNPKYVPARNNVVLFHFDQLQHRQI